MARGYSGHDGYNGYGRNARRYGAARAAAWLDWLPMVLLGIAVAISAALSVGGAVLDVHPPAPTVVETRRPDSPVTASAAEALREADAANRRAPGQAPRGGSAPSRAM